MIDNAELAKLTAEVVSSCVRNSALTEEELDLAIKRLPILIERVHEALLKIVQPDDIGSGGARLATAIGPAASPAVDPADSVHDDYIICLEDGRKFKTLRRHLQTKYGLTPEAYREKWRLPADYPMACKAYADSRSKIAKRIGLGAGGRGSQPAFPKATNTRRRSA